MRISIGAVTEEAMKCLNISNYPFSPEELSTNFRSLIKACHPDTAGKEGEEKAKEVIFAYTHLKNLAVSFTMTWKQREEAVKAFEEDEDIFTIWDTCPECKGSGKIEAKDLYGGNTVRCDECDQYQDLSFFGAMFDRTYSSGKKTLKCRACHGTGKFKQGSGKIVDCWSCKGTGIFKIVRCRKCGGTGRIPKIERERFQDCWKCGGLGKIKINPFNPVIRKGAILFK